MAPDLVDVAGGEAASTRAARGPQAGDAMLHPVALVGLALLVVNDHWAKAAYPGLVTGKLSDFAGLAFFPLLLVSVVELAQRAARRYARPSPRLVVAAVVATGVVFAAIQLSSPAAEAYRVAWAGMQWPARALAALVEGRAPPGLGLVRHTMDPTDLVALPALLSPLVVGLRRARATG